MHHHHHHHRTSTYSRHRDVCSGGRDAAATAAHVVQGETFSQHDVLPSWWPVYAAGGMNRTFWVGHPKSVKPIIDRRDVVVVSP
jgi:hypothetical protein